MSSHEVQGEKTKNKLDVSDRTSPPLCFVATP
jgi:hypothetical protein